MSKMSYPKKIIVNIVLIPIIIFLISLVTPLRYLSSDHHIESVMHSNLCENGEIVYQTTSHSTNGHYNNNTILKYADEYGYLVTSNSYYNLQLEHQCVNVQEIGFDNGLGVVPLFWYEEDDEDYKYVVVISQNDAVEKVIVETVDTDGIKPSIFTTLEKAELDGANIFVGATKEIAESTSFRYDGYCFDRTARGYDKYGNLIAEHLCGYAKRMESYK
ncbi:MAG: hypothetical protein IJM96_07595 [Clostridia bacterium]|nr:hypothetical protein [Clostridia bacterium]